MNRKAASTTAMFMIAGMVSACNSTEGPYRQGPWRHASAPRSYPVYSAPWGGKPAFATYAVVDQPVYERLPVVEAPLHPVRKSYDFHLEPALPPGSSLDRPAHNAGSASEPLSAPTSQQRASSQRETGADVQASAPGVFTPPQRPSSYAGMWKASVGSASCRIQLSSVPSLDLYKASAKGCSSDALKTVNGWSIRDNQVILFSRGQVVARLSGAEAALSGRLNGSEAEMTMTR